MQDKELHFQLLSAKEKMELCRAKLFTINQFYAYICIQFELKENNEIEDIAFDSNCLYYSSNINKYSRNDLTTLITLRLLQYIFIFDLNNSNDQELLYLLIQYNHYNLIYIEHWINLSKDSLTIFYNRRHNISNYINKIIINTDVLDKIHWAGNKINNNDYRYGFFKQIFDFDSYPNTKEIFSEIPSIPYIEKIYKEKLEKLIQIINYINMNNNNKDIQLTRLYWLLNLPQDLYVISIIYCISNNENLSRYIHEKNKPLLLNNYRLILN